MSKQAHVNPLVISPRRLAVWREEGTAKYLERTSSDVTRSANHTSGSEMKHPAAYATVCEHSVRAYDAFIRLGTCINVVTVHEAVHANCYCGQSATSYRP